MKRFAKVVLFTAVFFSLIRIFDVTAYAAKGTKEDPVIALTYGQLKSLMLQAPENETYYISLGADVSDLTDQNLRYFRSRYGYN